MGRTRYAIPNFFTSLNFLMGTFSVLLAPMGTQVFSLPFFGTRSALEWAAWLIIYSVLLDKLDGFFAKRLNASSAFGAEFDSLADLVAFGLAPAMLVFHGLRALLPNWVAVHGGLLLVALGFYVLCAAWRLARYNVAQADVKDYFMGMPTTLSGGWVALIFLLIHTHSRQNVEWMGFLLVGVQITLAALMISPFYISKLVSRKSKFFNLFQVANILGGYICGLAMIWPEFLLGQIAIYTAVGFVWGLIKRKEITAGIRQASKA